LGGVHRPPLYIRDSAERIFLRPFKSNAEEKCPPDSSDHNQGTVFKELRGALPSYLGIERRKLNLKMCVKTGVLYCMLEKLKGKNFK